MTEQAKVPLTIRVEPRGCKIHLMLGLSRVQHDFDHGHDCVCEPEIGFVQEGGPGAPALTFYLHDGTARPTLDRKV